MFQKIFLASVLAFVFAFVSPAMIIAGGVFKERLQQKINAPSKNIQYNNDVISSSQCEYNYQSPMEEQEGNRVGEDKKYDARNESRRERRKDLDQISPRPVLSAFAVYKTDYKAEIEEDVVTVKGNVLLEVFNKGWTQIPLIRSDVGLIDVSINRGASFVTMQAGKYFLMIDKPGRYNLAIEFLIKASRERENGPGNFNFEIIPAPISQFEFTMPESDVEIFVDPSIKLEVSREPKKTVAWAVMPNTSNINVRWSKALPKETITPVKLEPKIYLDTATYATIGEGIIRCQSTLNYSVLQSEVPSFRVALPDDVSVLDVRGGDLRDWKVSHDSGVQYLDVYLNFGVKGNYTLNLSYERTIGDGSLVAQIPWVKGVGVEREKGYFGLAAATNVELAVNKVDHVSPIDVKELPQAIWSSSSNPILLAFKYLNHPFSIDIDVTRHEEVPVLVAAIDSADYVTLQTDEGKNLTKAIFQVRNNVKQFIHLALPKDAVLWSAFVAGKPVKPAKDKNGAVLIPLEKSQSSGESLTQFPVEVVYLDKINKFGFLGAGKLVLPNTDIPVSILNWSIYFPGDFVYFNFGGDLKEAKYTGHRQGSFGRMVSMKAEMADKMLSSNYQVMPQQSLEQSSNNLRGVLPIKIDIPTEGRLCRFSKMLVTEKESPSLSFNFIYTFKQVHGLFRLGLFILVLFAGIRIFWGIFRKKDSVRNS